MIRVFQVCEPGSLLLFCISSAAAAAAWQQRQQVIERSQKVCANASIFNDLNGKKGKEISSVCASSNWTFRRRLLLNGISTVSSNCRFCRFAPFYKTVEQDILLLLQKQSSRRQHSLSLSQNVAHKTNHPEEAVFVCLCESLQWLPEKEQQQQLLITRKLCLERVFKVRQRGSLSSLFALYLCTVCPSENYVRCTTTTSAHTS